MNQNQHRVQCGVWGLAAMLLILPMLVPASKGQDSRGQRVSKANSTRWIALVIGNAAYTEAPLKNPVNDARDMAAALREMGFEVTELHNQNFEQMETAIQTFGQRLSGGGAGLFYFAGHGVQTKDNQNYLIPVGGTITAENVKYRAVNVGELTEQMETAQNGINLIILDACRNNPWRGLRSGARGLAAMDAPKGTLIAYATAPGSEAADGTEGNGLYTKELLAAMRSPGVKVEDVFKRVRVAVNAKSGGQQTPWELSSLTGDFYFMAENDPPLKPTPNESPKVLTAAELEALAWNEVKDSRRVKDLEAFLGEYGNGVYGSLARVKLAKLKGESEPEPKPAPAKPVLTAGSRAQYGGMEFVYIPAGSFRMGGDKYDDEKPVHRVTISEGFYLGRYEVTQGEWERIMGSNPSEFKGNARLPVENVSWNDAQTFIKKLNEKEGREVYRLPSEAEWEYACRAGTSGDYAGNLDGMGWYNGNAGSKTHAVGEKSPNGWGLYDMHGNVWEWCGDWYDSSYYQNSSSVDPRGPSAGSRRVVRGGGWYISAVYCRSAYRSDVDPGNRSSVLGFRLLRMVDR